MWRRLLASGRFGSRSDYSAGEIYSVEDKKGFRVVKVLAADARAVHVRLYKNIYPLRPLQIDESTLTLGTINDREGFGVGHLPLSRKEFQSWRPVLVMKSSIAEEELEGYEIWKQSRGGLWEIPK